MISHVPGAAPSRTQPHLAVPSRVPDYVKKKKRVCTQAYPSRTRTPAVPNTGTLAKMPYPCFIANSISYSKKESDSLYEFLTSNFIVTEESEKARNAIAKSLGLSIA